jgi:hypothetical protein
MWFSLLFSFACMHSSLLVPPLALSLSDRLIFSAEATCKNFFIYLICHDFRKIIGRTKILEKYTSSAVAHGAWSSCRRGPRWQGSHQRSAVLAGGARTWRRGPRRQEILAPQAAAAPPAYIRGRAPTASPHSSLTPPSKSSAFNLFGALMRYVF